MNDSTGVLTEETLDPEDWESMRALGHRMLDDALDYLETLSERPVWQHAPPHVKAHFEGSPTLDPKPAREVYQEGVTLMYIHPSTSSNS